MIKVVESKGCLGYGKFGSFGSLVVEFAWKYSRRGSIKGRKGLDF